CFLHPILTPLVLSTCVPSLPLPPFSARVHSALRHTSLFTATLRSRSTEQTTLCATRSTLLSTRLPFRFRSVAIHLLSIATMLASSKLRLSPTATTYIRPLKAASSHSRLAGTSLPS
ncbi:hypothetical protein GGI04_002671, partial [Coemansia thaxteri]